MRKLVALVMVAMSVTVLLAAQQTPTFRARTDIVELDISVLDKDRRPVRGLTAKDFVVLEDGKPQEIAIFEAIDVPDAVSPAVEWMRDVTPDVTTNDVRVTRLWVLVVDDGMIPQTAFPTKSSKQIVRDVIEKFGPEDLATIVFTTDSRQAQDFTNDRAKLLATLDNYSPGNAGWMGKTSPSVDPDWQFQLGALLTLRNVMDALIAVPHNRKALIWITPGIPHGFIPPIQEAPLGGSRETMAEPMLKLRIIEMAKEIFDVARRANLPVYPIDPCGLGGISTCTIMPSLPNLMHPALEFLRITARNTGGHAILNTNDFTPGINSIFEENKSYYLIGYNPTNAKTDGTFRKLEVRVNREDVEVRTRSSYYAPKPGDGPPKNTNETLSRATAAPIPVRELPLRATAAPFAIPGRGRTAAVTIALGVTQPVPEGATAERLTMTTDLRVTAFTTEGDNKGTQRQAAKVTLRAGAKGDADYETLSRIDLPPGRYRLRLAAHLASAAKTGTVMVDVIVPDFSRDPASMSGVVLSAAPGRPSAPRDLFKEILPIIPTAQRAFTPSEHATALFYLYQHAGRSMDAAQVAIRITDSRGARLINEAQTLPIDRFVGAQAQTVGAASMPTTGGTKSVATMAAPQAARESGQSTLRAAEFRYQLPLDRLPAGRYLLTFEAMMGETKLRRDVQFEVK